MDAMLSKKTKLLCLLLCLMMVLPMALSACNGNDTDKPGETTAATTAGATQAGGTSAATTAGSTQGSSAPSQEGPQVDEWLEVKDLGENGSARLINFLSCSDTGDQPYNTKYYFIRHEEDDDVVQGDKMAESAKTRTLYMEETFNVAFNSVGLASNSLFTTVQASLMGNGGEYDLIYPHPTIGMVNFLTSGLFQNLYSFLDEDGEQIIHLDQPWWNQEQVNQYSVEDKLYIAVNDMSICGQGFVAMVYNRTLYNELQLSDDPYTLVYDGEWTIAKLKELAMNYGEGAGDDGVLNYEDKIGYASSTNAYFWNMGGRVISKDDNGEFYIAIDGEHATKIGNALYSLMWESDDKVWTIAEDKYGSYATFGTTKTLASFKAGNILFYAYDLGGLYKHLWNAPFDVGYLPPVKLDTNQEDYYSLCNAGFFAIPQKVKDNTVSAIILEALAIHSYTNHRVNFFDDVLLSRMSENPEDFKMLNYIHETKVYDWGGNLFVDKENMSRGFVEYWALDKKDPAKIENYAKSRMRAWQTLLSNIEAIKNAEFAG